MKKVASKGYILEVESWENDGDNCQTNQMVFDTLAEATAVQRLAEEVFQNSTNGDGGIGNANCRGEVDGVIMSYLAEDDELVKLHELDINDKTACENMVMEYNEEVMGYTEWYYSRVFESSEIYYIKEDVYAETI